jgi:hypothetical protein
MGRMEKPNCFADRDTTSMTDSLIVGKGYNYGQPINSELVNASSLDEHNFMGGIRYKLTETVEFVGVLSFTPTKNDR